MIFGRREQTCRLMGFFMRPMFPFALEFLLLAPLVLGMDVPEITPLYLFLSPWLLLVLGLLNLPLLIQVFRVFQMDIRTRRNHALEHATIHFLWAQGLRRAAGRVDDDGFRVSGGASPEEIRAAFGQVQELVTSKEPLPHVSRHGGSNRVTALGFAIGLLLLVTVISLAIRPPLWLRALALVSVVLVFTAMRHVMGNVIQARYFMSTDFSAVSILAIRKAKSEATEVPPVYFVATGVDERSEREAT